MVFGSDIPAILTLECAYSGWSAGLWLDTSITGGNPFTLSGCVVGPYYASFNPLDADLELKAALYCPCRVKTWMEPHSVATQGYSLP
jgi:hypothetical protein